MIYEHCVIIQQVILIVVFKGSKSLLVCLKTKRQRRSLKFSKEKIYHDEAAEDAKQRKVLIILIRGYRGAKSKDEMRRYT